jgi:hypothetical protein
MIVSNIRAVLRNKFPCHDNDEYCDSGIVPGLYLTLIAPYCRFYFPTAYQGLAKVITLSVALLGMYVLTTQHRGQLTVTPTH